MFTFTDSQYVQFKSWLQDMNKYRDNAWPDESTWLTFTGLPKYSLYQTQLQRDFATVVVFESEVKTPFVIADRFTVSDFNDTLMF